MVENNKERMLSCSIKRLFVAPNTCTHTNTHTHTHIQTHAHAHTRAHTRTHTQVHTHSGTLTCKDTYTFRHAHMHTHIHTAHTHTYTHQAAHTPTILLHDPQSNMACTARHSTAVAAAAQPLPRIAQLYSRQSSWPLMVLVVTMRGVGGEEGLWLGVWVVFALPGA